MASKTISLSVKAYEKLKNARRYAGESFTQVVMRAHWPEDTVTGGELLKLWEKEPAFFTDEELDAVEGMPNSKRLYPFFKERDMQLKWISTF